MRPNSPDLIAGSGGSRQGNHHFETQQTRVCQPNHFCRFNPALTTTRHCIVRWHVPSLPQPLWARPQWNMSASKSAWGVWRTFRWLICRNSENTDKPEERKPSGFLLFGSTTALTSRTDPKSLGKGLNNEQGKFRSALHANCFNLRAFLLTTAKILRRSFGLSRFTR